MKLSSATPILKHGGGVGAFSIQKLILQILDLYTGIFKKNAVQVVLRRLVLGAGVRVSCFSFTLMCRSSRTLWGGAVGGAGFYSKLVEEAGA